MLPEERKAAREATRSSSFDGEEDGLPEVARLQRTTASMVVGSKALPSGDISIRRVRDANAKEVARGVVTATEFHPLAPLVMVGSMDEHLRFFEVDGTRNRNVASVHCAGLPVTDAKLTGDGMKAFAVGRRPYWYMYDLGAAALHKAPRLQGRVDKSLESFALSPVPGESTMAFLCGEGDIVLASTSTNRTIGTMRASAPARTARFTHDGTKLLSSGDDGVVHVWDLRTHRLLARHYDEGMQCSTAMDIAPADDTYVIGSDSGIVNAYATDAALSGGGDPTDFSTAQHLKPTKVLTQLTTRINIARFNRDGSVLAMSSRTIKDALRLVHVPTMTVFHNWPTDRTPLHYVSAVGFSPSGGWLAVGNDRGRALLFRMEQWPERIE
jgi:U3 small nucleolar RNA-associated protein 18